MGDCTSSTAERANIWCVCVCVWARIYIQMIYKQRAILAGGREERGHGHAMMPKLRK